MLLPINIFSNILSATYPIPIVILLWSARLRHWKPNHT